MKKLHLVFLGSIIALVVAAAPMASAVVKSAHGSGRAASGGTQSLTLDERVAYQRAIEQVCWRHRLWPKGNPQPKPALDEVVPESVIQAKVEDSLRQSQALEVYWQRPITGQQLQAEMERMAHQTKQPEVLREVWAALGNDPLVMAECLARPVLVERLIHNWYASDERFHGELKRRAEEELSWPGAVERMREMTGEYREVEWRLANGESENPPSAFRHPQSESPPSAIGRPLMLSDPHQLGNTAHV